MKTNFTPIALAFLMMLSAAVTAQTQRQIFGKTVQSINPHNGKIRCVSSEYEQSLQEQYPERATEQFENWLAPKVQAVQNRLINHRDINTVVKIPVVVHVISNGDAVGTNENISDARVISQITVLNQDFRKMISTPGYNTDPVGADMEIEFQMALRKPDGSASNGIDRVTRSLATYATEASVETMKTATIWNPAQYFNIWIVYFSDDQNAEMYGTLGYAQFPSSSGLGGLDTNGGAATTDGLAIDYRCYGTVDIANDGEYFTDYDKGRTATHEIGHFFGLRHIWGDNTSCSVNATDSNKDYCPDTPAAKVEHYDCAQVYNTCTAAAGNDMTANYMDYSNDTCMNIFTLNQKARMVAVLQNSPRRGTLTTSPALEAPLATTAFAMLEGINLYPNPAADFVNISVSNTVALPESYTVYNTLGQVVAAKKVTTAADLSINTTELNQGIYLVKITRGSASKTLQFVKK